MKIVCVGCSYTYGLVTRQPDYTKTYPYYLSKMFPNAEVYNLGIGAAGNMLIDIILEYAINSIKPNFVVRQITYPNRFFTFKKDPRNVGIENFIRQREKNYYDFYPQSLQKHFFYWTAKALVHSGSDYTFNQQKKIRKQFFANYPKEIIQYLSDTAVTNSEVQLKDIPNFFFNWNNDGKYKKFDTIENVIGHNEENIHDKSNHYNATGNKKVAEYIRTQGMSNV